MKKTLTTVLTVATAGALWLQVPRVSAQDGAPPPPPAPGAAAPGAPGAGGPGADRRAEFQQRMEERVKTALKASDDEWSVIQPLLEKVETKQREALTTRFGGLMGGGGPRPRRDDANGGGNGGGRRERAENAGGGPRPGGRGGSPEAQALTEALQNDNSSVDEIKTKLAALREERKKSAAELAQAREDLKKVLNMRQEASLVAMGILD